MAYKQVDLYRTKYTVSWMDKHPATILVETNDNKFVGMVHRFPLTAYRGVTYTVWFLWDKFINMVKKMFYLSIVETKKVELTTLYLT